MSREDIVHYNENRSTEEAQENGRKGGIASGAARRRKRRMKEAADLFLSLPVTDTKTFNKMVKAGVSADDIDYQMAVIVGMTTKAIKGDAKAAKILIDILGGSSEDEAKQNTLEKLDDVLSEIGGVV